MRGKRAKQLRRLAKVVASSQNQAIKDISYKLIKRSKVVMVNGSPRAVNNSQIILGDCTRKIYKNLKTGWKRQGVSV